ncbi:MAG: hypothetical protein JWL66_198 [Sphingomonadales bacterium]|nr:hypothetical protein [Sphingomonadales bacterium]
MAPAVAAKPAVATMLHQPFEVPVRTMQIIARPIVRPNTVRPSFERSEQAATFAPVRLMRAVEMHSSPEMTPFSLSSPVSTASRLSGSVWALYRPDSGGAALGSGGTLGGSQAGARIYYEPGPRGVALTARISAPLAVRDGREASVGVGLRGRSVGILVERRVALDRGGRNAMSVTAYGGLYDVVLPEDFSLSGYVQFGVVGARRRDRFVDGAVRVIHPLAGAGGVKISAGAAISGGAQPGVLRGDIGPELIADVPVGARHVRITAGWRERVAGRAAPGSGPSVTTGFDF